MNTPIKRPLRKAVTTRAARAPITAMRSATIETARPEALRVVFKVSFFTMITAAESGRK
jgi:hypothetical protein